jgi:hypothetical protein
VPVTESPPTPDWRVPYRSTDESGSPAAAGVVAWNWIGDLAQRQRANDAALLVIDSHSVQGGGKVTVLYSGTRVLACATTFRDEMNCTVLIRWAAEGVA